MSDENCPSATAPTRRGGATNFPAQFTASPTKFSDRDVLRLLGHKVPSSVPGRRSSIGCPRDRRALAPVIVFEDPVADDLTSCGQETSLPAPATARRAKSLKPHPAARNPAKPVSLRRL